MQRRLRSRLREPSFKRREVAGLSLAEASYPSGLRMGRHQHALAAFGIVLQGGYTEKVGTRTRTCGPGTVVFHPAGEEHAVEFHEEPVRIFRVDLDELWLNLVRDYSTVLDSPAVFEGGQPAGLALRLYREFQSADSAAPLAIKGLALEVLAEASRRGTTSATRTPPLWLRRAQDMIRERFAETLTLGAIADAVAVHPVHLARAFRRVHGCSIGEYVRRLRVDFACRALSNSALPLAAIAISAGFADQSHFTGVFRRQTGLTPLSFRKTCGGC